MKNRNKKAATCEFLTGQGEKFHSPTPLDRSVNVKRLKPPAPRRAGRDSIQRTCGLICVFFFFCINNSLGSVNKKKKDAPLKDVPHELLEKIEKRQIELFVEFLFHQSEFEHFHLV